MNCLVPACKLEVDSNASFCDAHLASYLDFMGVQTSAERAARAAELQTAAGRLELSRRLPERVNEALQQAIAQDGTPIATLAPTTPTLAPPLRVVGTIQCFQCSQQKPNGRFICMDCSHTLVERMRGLYGLRLEDTHADEMLYDKLVHRASAESVYRDLALPFEPNSPLNFTTPVRNEWPGTSFEATSTPLRAGQNKLVLGVLAALSLGALFLGAYSVASGGGVVIATKPVASPPLHIWTTRVVSNSASQSAQFRVITQGEGKVGFIAAGVHYTVDMSASEFKRQFGKPDTEDEVIYEYHHDGLAVNIKGGLIERFRFYEMPLDGYSVAKLDVDRGFDVHNNAAALAAIYQVPFRQSGNDAAFQLPGGTVRYSYKFGLIESVTLDGEVVADKN